MVSTMARRWVMYTSSVLALLKRNCNPTRLNGEEWWITNTRLLRMGTSKHQEVAEGTKRREEEFSSPYLRPDFLRSVHCLLGTSAFSNTHNPLDDNDWGDPPLSTCSGWVLGALPLSLIPLPMPPSDVILPLEHCTHVLREMN